jgi:hypothetical protein
VLRYLNQVGISNNTSVAKRLDIKVSTAHRILMVLVRMGMLRHDPRGHQFILASHVRSLSAGFRDSPFVDEVATPRMQTWTRKHGMRLMLVAEQNDSLVVLASTFANWPLNRELPVSGNKLSEVGCCEAAILRPARARRPSPNTGSPSSSGVLRRVVVRTIADETQIGVMLATMDGFRGSLSIRCPSELVRGPKAVRHLVGELRTLADSIVAASDGRSDAESNTLRDRR